MSIELDFKQWIGDLKIRIRRSQIRAMVKVNDEMLRLYWDLGRDIVARQLDAVWGGGFFENLSKELKAEFPDMQGFSVTNLKYCKKFYLFYSQSNQIRQQLVDELSHQFGDESQIAKDKYNIIHHQLGDELAVHPLFLIPWRHHVEIFTKCKSVPEAMFYVQKTIKNGWSRAVLMNFIEAGLWESQGKAVNNFDRL